jgi:MFS superfamily sulfate permease-like transporter
LRIDFVDLLMGSFVPHLAAYVVIIATTLAMLTQVRLHLQRYPRNGVALAGLTAVERKQRASLNDSFDSSAQTSARLLHCPE